MLTRTGCALLTLLLLLAAVPHPAFGQEDRGLRRLGFRAGGTIDPDQFHFGLHFNAGRVAERVRFQPGVEVGLGSEQTLLLGNFDFLYLAHRSRTLQILLGGGPTVGARWRDDAGGGSRTDGQVGLSLVAAMEFGSRPVSDVPESRGSGVRYLAELRGGVGDLPGFKVTIGINF